MSSARISALPSSLYGLALPLFAALVLVLVGCESLDLGGGDEEDAGIPEDGLLGAKITALEYAMDNLSARDRRFVDDDYAAYGISDRDELQEDALVAVFDGRTPPVVKSSRLYSRSSNSQWMDGRPAMKWTASAVKAADSPQHAEVLVGWMHSKLINQFTTYVLEFDGSGWSVIDVRLVERQD